MIERCRLIRNKFQCISKPTYLQTVHLVLELELLFVYERYVHLCLAGKERERCYFICRF